MSSVYPPPAPSPGPSMMDYVKGFLGGGLTGAAQTGGMQMPGWSNAIGNFLQKPEVNMALGAMTPIGKTGVSMGSPEAVPRSANLNVHPEEWQGINSEIERIRQQLSQLIRAPGDFNKPLADKLYGRMDELRRKIGPAKD